MNILNISTSDPRDRFILYFVYGLRKGFCLEDIGRFICIDNINSRLSLVIEVDAGHDPPEKLLIYCRLTILLGPGILKSKTDGRTFVTLIYHHDGLPFKTLNDENLASVAAARDLLGTELFNKALEYLRYAV